MDSVSDEAAVAGLEAAAAGSGLPFFRISAVTGDGVPALLEAAWRHVAARPKGAGGNAAAPAILTPRE